MSWWKRITGLEVTQEEEHHPGRGGGMAEQDLPVLVAVEHLIPCIL